MSAKVGAVASHKAGHELGMAVAVRKSTEADVLGPDTAVTFSTWEWYSADDVKGGTAKDITIWKYHEGDWRIYKEIFNMP